MKDLFKSKTEQLKDFMRNKEYFASHDIFKWGSDNFYNSADRAKRHFQEQGLIKKLDDNEKIFRGFRCKDDVYRWVNAVR